MGEGNLVLTSGNIVHVVGNQVDSGGRPAPGTKGSMRSPSKGKSKYQLRIERNDPNFINKLKHEALIQLGKGVQSGDMRAIALVLESTNALRVSRDTLDIGSLAALLAPPAQATEAGTKAPAIDLRLSPQGQNFPPSSPQPIDSTDVNGDNDTYLTGTS